MSITNPGVSGNVAKQTSLADAIAANLTASRTEPEPQPLQQQAKPGPGSEPSPEPEPAPEPKQEPEAAVTTTDGEAPDTPEQDDSTTSGRYTLADFADAAELDVDSLIERLDVEVTKDGETTTTNLADVLKGYRWDAVNTQRAQDIAERRRQADARLQEFTTAKTQLDALLGMQFDEVVAEEQALDQQYRAVNWAGLQARQDGSYADTEAQFSRARDELRRRKDKLAQTWTQAQQQAEELTKRQQAEALPRQRAELLERIPEWRDDKRAREESEKLTRYVADTWGFTPEEQSQITDPRTIAAMRRLWVLEEQAKGVPLAQKKVKTAPKVLKPGQKAAREDGRAEVRRKLQGRLKRSGHRNDLAALILESRR